MFDEIIKGDTINLECTANQSIENWKIRCEIFDCKCSSIKLATANSGGSSDEIEITDVANGVFIIHVAKNLTTNFDDNAYLEIKIENENGEIFTSLQKSFEFKPGKITWENPS